MSVRLGMDQRSPTLPVMSRLDRGIQEGFFTTEDTGEKTGFSVIIGTNILNSCDMVMKKSYRVLPGFIGVMDLANAFIS